MHEIKTMTIYFYNSFYNGYCLCHVPCVNFFLLFLFLFLFLYERIFYLQETIYRIVNSKRKHQNELLRIASLCACTRCVPISDRHTKCKCTVKYSVKRQPKTCNLFCNIVAKRVEQRYCSFYHPRKKPCNLIVVRQVRTSAVKRSTSLIQLVLQQCCKTSCTFFVARVTVA